MGFNLNVAILICGVVFFSSAQYRVPLQNQYNAPLIVELDMSDVNKQLKNYIDPELNKINAMKTSVSEFEQRISAEIYKLKNTITEMESKQGDFNQQRPAFSVSIKTDTSFPNGQPYKFDKIHINIGNMYNPLTGLAIIPSNGNYYINWHVLTNGGHSTYPYLKVNNEYRSSTACEARRSRGIRIACGNTVIIPLKKGDTIFIEEWTGNRGRPNVQGGFSSFTVFKL